MKRQSWRQGLELWGFCGVSDHLRGGAWMLSLLLLTALWHGGGNWEADEQGPVAEGGGCGSRGRADDHSVDNSGVPLHHLTGGHSPDRTTDRRMSKHRTTDSKLMWIWNPLILNSLAFCRSKPVVLKCILYIVMLITESGYIILVFLRLFRPRFT